MSLARAFTTRRLRQTLEFRDSKDADSIDDSSAASESFFSRKKNRVLTTHGSIRNKISAPVELTHTTNMFSYSAPDIKPRANSRAATTKSSSSVSGRSDDESDSGETAASTPPTSPDTSSLDDKRDTPPEPNHLSCYFMPPRQSASEVNGLGIAATDNVHALTSEAPAIPKRAPSHTRQSYDSLARKRSTSRMSEQSLRSLSSKASFSFSRSSSSSTSTSATSASHTAALKSTHKPSCAVPPPVQHASPASVTTAPPVSHKNRCSESHPFGHELAKVSELVEEFGKEAEEQRSIAPSTNPTYAAEERELARQGLKKYSAESYISDIQSLMSTFFGDARPVAVAASAATAWI
ncbi:hypothetical protein SEPCBS119000_005619 [Sporothrix epigloea]|uniref:Uncharacterized protein n=1 Tax=Sporothrix epigloea TaxID=1892477 RepID=A0ABP0E2N3_9PEZI